MKNLIFFIFPFSSYIGSEKLKIDLFSIFHASRMEICGSSLKLHPKLKAELEHSYVDNYPVQSL